MHVELSPTKLILCNIQGPGLKKEMEQKLAYNINLENLEKVSCYGNTLYDAWSYLLVVGTTTLKCLPYDDKLIEGKFKSVSEFTGVKDLPLCNVITGPDGDMCQDYYTDKTNGVEIGTPARFYRCMFIYTIPGSKTDGGNEKNIREDIFKTGPVSSAIEVYPNFYTFDSKNEIYDWDGKGRVLIRTCSRNCRLGGFK